MQETGLQNWVMYNTFVIEVSTKSMNRIALIRKVAIGTDLMVINTRTRTEI